MAVSKNFERRAIDLSKDEWSNLEALASKLQCLASAGPSAGKPSWRTLIKQIANEELIILKEDKS